MSATIVVAFVQVQHGLDMDFPFACPLHQVADERGGLRGVVDV